MLSSFYFMINEIKDKKEDITHLLPYLSYIYYISLPKKTILLVSEPNAKNL
jgi:hypothetical protein